MKCVECGCHRTRTNDATGEVTCIDCGMVHIANGWEVGQVEFTTETKGLDAYSDLGKVYPTVPDTHREIGSIISFNDAVKTKGMTLRMYNRRAKRGIRSRERVRAEVAMIVSRYTSGTSAYELIDECCANYNTLRDEHFFNGVTMEIRVASITYYILKDAGFRLTPSSHQKIAGGVTKNNTRWAKKIATRFRNPSVFARTTWIVDAEKIVTKLVPIGKASDFRETALGLVNHVGNLKEALNERMTQNDVAATVWIASKLVHANFKQSDIREHGNASDYGMRTSIGNICQMLGIERKELRKASHAYDAKEILGGIK